jgi:ATP-dependent RNA helicase DeaD
VTTFADLGLSESTLKALSDVGYESPSPIQEQAIPPMLEGRDVIGQAQTGSGKTAAFGLPMLEQVDPSISDVQGLVLTPTRELCIQVTQAIRAYGKSKGVDVVATFGGAPIRSQQAQLSAGGHVVVGTVAACSTSSPARRCTSPSAASSCSTRPTRCSTSGSSRTSSGSCR